MNLHRSKSILLLLFLAAFACQTEKSTDLIFEGVVSGPWEGHSIHLYNNLTGERDSADIIDGRFTMILPFSEPTRHMFFSTYDTRVKRGYAPFGILVEKPGTIQIELDIEQGFTQAVITGSKPHELYAGLLSKQAEINARYRSDDGGRDTEAISVALAHEIETMVRKNPSSYATAFVLDRMGDNLELSVREELYQLMPENLKQTHFGIRTHNLIQGLKRSAIGNQVENFSLMNEKGEPVSFHQYLGQYVLVDFWASWCGPCIAEIPKFKEIYEKYRNDGFEIVGISIDKNHEAWLRAITHHELEWPQMIDNEEVEIANSHFAVTAVPTTFLLDPDGKIMIRNIKGEELDQKLSELLRN
jgi:peroxiredoxin